MQKLLKNQIFSKCINSENEKNMFVKMMLNQNIALHVDHLKELLAFNTQSSSWDKLARTCRQSIM